MLKLIYLVAFAVYCLAAPTIRQEDNKCPLQRPSPINPDVISEPKPNEKITMITDPQEVAKHKREIEQTAYEPALTHYLLPTLPPQEQEQHDSDENSNGTQHSDEDAQNSKSVEDLNDQHQHHRQKREQQPSVVVENKPTAAKPGEKFSADSKPTTPKRTRKPKPNTSVSSSTPSPVPQKKVAPAPETKKQRLRRDVSQDDASSSTTAVPVPLIFKDEHKVPYEGASQAAYIKHEIPHSIPAKALSESHNVAPLKMHLPENVKPQTLPAAVPPVDEASTIDPQTLHNLNHALQADIVHPSISPATANHGISNFPATLGHVKRDIPVPLVPKYHHPEESPKDDEAKDENEHEKHDDVEKKSTENKEKVQIPDLTVPHQSQQPQHEAHKPLIEEHIEVAASSTTEHPVIRHKPVPVAELFARPKQPEN